MAFKERREIDSAFRDKPVQARVHATSARCEIPVDRISRPAWIFGDDLFAIGRFRTGHRNSIDRIDLNFWGSQAAR